MQEQHFLQSLHKSTSRNYLERMTAEKPECMRVAKRFDRNYWDGERCFGYGGYRYDGRWKPVAQAMAKHYEIKCHHRILDIGCGKAHLLYELTPFTEWLDGIDISEYALENAKIKFLSKNDCRDLCEMKDAFYDFTYSINVLHNLGYKDLKQAIREMVRVTKPEGKSYICVESYRNEEELTNLQAWQLTCLSYYSPDDWKEILADNGYQGDVEFIFFE